jgi:RNA polymerase sigma-70 factor (ECF subfamily)
LVLGIDDSEFSRDRSLVERVQLGDKEAFAELYRRHHDRLFRYCLYRLGETHEAQDVVQEAFTRAWLNAPRIQADLRFYPWLRTIAGNLCTDVGRRRARVQPAAAVDPGSTDGGQERIVDRVDITLLEEAMARLPERHRQVLELREAGGLSYEQLADRTGTSVGTVESLLWRARQGLKRQFAVVSGESVLTGLPVVGWLLRRAHSAHARLSAQLSEWHAENLLAIGGALGGLAVGSVVAVALMVGGARGSGDRVPPAAVTTARPANSMTTAALAQLASQPVLDQASASSAVANTRTVTAAQTAPRPFRTGRTELVDPIQTDHAAAAQEAQQDPVKVSVGQATIGADPRAMVAYIATLPSALPKVPY